MVQFRCQLYIYSAYNLVGSSRISAMACSNHVFRMASLVLVLALIASACTSRSPTPLPGTSSPGLEENQATSEPTPFPQSTPPDLTKIPEPHDPVPSPTPSPSDQQNPQYTLTARLDYARHHLTVEEKIDYVNRASEALSELLLMVEPAYYAGVFHLTSLDWGAGKTAADASWDGAQLQLPLSEPIQPGEHTTLSITYELDLPSPQPSPTTRPVPFGYTARQTNLVDWYPFIPPYEAGKGWLAHRAGYFGEHLVYEEADFQVNIQITDRRSDLTVAASSEPQVDGDWMRYRLENARNFVWSVSNEYQVETETVGGVTVYGYYFPFDSAAGKAALHTTAQALALYNQLFGPYPRKSLSVVEADFLDGMEYEGLYFLSDGFYNLYQGQPGEYLVAIAAHETAHQWWYALVGNDQALEPWLDEALCTYSERLFYEYTYPDALDWWWAYRIQYYEPKGWVNGSIYNPDGYRAYRDAVYLNGALFLEALRKQVGDTAFLAFLKDYARQEAHKIATTQDFFSILKAHTQEDIQPLVNQYFKNQ